MDELIRPGPTMELGDRVEGGDLFHRRLQTVDLVFGGAFVIVVSFYCCENNLAASVVG